MIFIADSGSTKCDAVFIDDAGKEVAGITFMGFNPYFHSSSFIQKELESVPEIKKYGERVSEVYFYGAGCSSPSLNAEIAEGLAPHFPHASIHVDHDLKACAFSVYDGRPAICCILGTGSNSVYFDGKNIREEVPSLAFILGDEGSGSDIGKRILTGYFYKKMPEELREDFRKSYGLEKDAVISRVYKEPHANVFLAGLAPFAHKHRNHPFFRKMILACFNTFLDIHVNCYPEAKSVPVHFIGSVAYYFRDILEEALQLFGLEKGQLIQKPLDGLIKYHRKHIIKS